MIVISGLTLLRLQSTSRVDFEWATQFLVKVDNGQRKFHHSTMKLLQTAVNKPWSSNVIIMDCYCMQLVWGHVEEICKRSLPFSQILSFMETGQFSCLGAGLGGISPKTWVDPHFTYLGWCASLGTYLSPWGCWWACHKPAGTRRVNVRQHSDTGGALLPLPLREPALLAGLSYPTGIRKVIH